MVRCSIDWYGLLTDDTSDSSLFEIWGAPATERLYQNRICRAAHFSSTGRTHAVDSFDSNPVTVDCIGRCTCNRHIVLWCRIISIHSLRNCTLPSGSNPFNTLMIPHLAHHNLSWISNLSRKHSNCLLQKAVLLSVRISFGSPRL